LTLLTLLVFRESFSLAMILAIIIGFIGTVLLLHPTLDRESITTGLLGLLSGLLAAVAMFNVRQLGRSGEPEYRTVFYFSVLAALMSGVALLFTTIHPLEWNRFLILIGLALTATLAQLALTRAYGIGNTTLVSSLSYSTIVFASLFGIVIWNETLPLEGWVGMALIMGSGVLSFKSSPKLEGK
jgi:drug/metabolite transporter (DMT)-like permease